MTTVQYLSKTRSFIKTNILERFERNQALVVWGTLIGLCIVATITSPVFMTQRNMMNVLRQASVLGILAVGQTIVLLSKGADLSQSTMMTLSAVVAFQFLAGRDTMIAPVIILSLVLGAIVGLFNGIMVSKVRVPPFLMTLGTREIIYGLGLVFTRGAPQGFITPLFRQVLGRFDVFGIPGQALLWLVALAIGWVILTKTTFGRKLYATGGNRRAARQSGIKTDRTIITAYIISGMLAAFAGLVLGARSGNADNSMGTGYELNAVAASVIGGTSFAGGRGGLVGTIGGVLLMTVLQNVLNLHGVNPDVYLIIMGMVIVAAVAVIKAE